MDHKNLTFDTLKMKRMLWHTKNEEFLPMLHYIEGSHNILANNLSRLHCLVTPTQIAEGKKLVEPAEVSNEEEDKAYFLDEEYSSFYDDNVWEWIECYLNLPDTPHPDENPLNYAHICELQQQDKQLLALQVKYPDRYVILWLDDDVNDIICYKEDSTQPNWKIALPESMVIDTIKLFHQEMGHSGEKRLPEMLNHCYNHPKLRHHINKLKWKDFQTHKLAGRGYGLLPKWEVRIAPWEEVTIIRNGFMPHIMGHKYSHMYAREVRWNFEFDSWYLSKICLCLSKKIWLSLHLLFLIMSTLKGDVRVKIFHFNFFCFGHMWKKVNIV
jgi:hypothetical protein